MATAVANAESFNTPEFAVNNLIGMLHLMSLDNKPFDILPASKKSMQKQRWYRFNKCKKTGKNVVKLYHQTSAEAAKAILTPGGKMQRGTDGIVGGGIYFAVDPDDTMRKANSKGVVLECEVVLGNVLVMEKNKTHRKVTFTELMDMGYDSVMITGMPTGIEFVVYNFDQVKVLRALVDK